MSTYVHMYVCELALVYPAYFQQLRLPVSGLPTLLSKSQPFEQQSDGQRHNSVWNRQHIVHRKK